MEYQNTEQLYKICQNKQPVVFRMDQGQVIPDSHFIHTMSPALLAEKYGKEDVLLSFSQNRFIPIPLEKAVLLLDAPNNDTDNHHFIMDLPIHHYFQSIDPFLRPFGTIQTEYDFAFGFTTGLRHHQHHSFFVYAVGANLDIKLTPYKNIVANGRQDVLDGYIYPDPHKNKETLLNCWDNDAEEPDITFWDVSVPAGYCIFIPPYWWYSIRQTDPSQGWMAIFKYDTIMARVVYYLEKIRGWMKQSRTDETEEDETEIFHDE
jgi:hypothetical protein